MFLTDTGERVQEKDLKHVHSNGGVLSDTAVAQQEPLLGAQKVAGPTGRGIKREVLVPESLTLLGPIVIASPPKQATKQASKQGKQNKAEGSACGGLGLQIGDEVSVSEIREVVRATVVEAVSTVLPDETVASLGKILGAVEKVVGKCFKEAS